VKILDEVMTSWCLKLGETTDGIAALARKVATLGPGNAEPRRRGGQRRRRSGQ
jgi:hypothetical protein